MHFKTGRKNFYNKNYLFDADFLNLKSLLSNPFL